MRGAPERRGSACGRRQRPRLSAVKPGYGVPGPGRPLQGGLYPARAAATAASRGPCVRGGGGRRRRLPSQSPCVCVGGGATDTVPRPVSLSVVSCKVVEERVPCGRGAAAPPSGEKKGGGTAAKAREGRWCELDARALRVHGRCRIRATALRLHRHGKQGGSIECRAMARLGAWWWWGGGVGGVGVGVRGIS